jgi:hypothetical protein
LLDEAIARSTERGTNGELAFAGGGLGEKQVSDVGASDEKKEGDGAEQDEEGKTNTER